MRTTVTIDDDLLAEVKVRAAREHRSIGSVMEEALDRFLNEPGPQPAERFELPRFACSGEALVDINDGRAMREVLDEGGLGRHIV